MFTGLVEATGLLCESKELGESKKLGESQQRGSGATLSVDAELGKLELGESIAVNGVCLTVARLAARGFEVDVSAETVDKTTLGSLARGEKLNLERALQLSDRLGGHLVSGHVDGVASVVSTEPVGESLRVVLQAPGALMPFIAKKGSVCLDGVSLTVNDLSGDQFDVMLVPHTRRVTNFSVLGFGRLMNLEVDMMARYLLRWLESADHEERRRRRQSLASLIERTG